MKKYFLFPIVAILFSFGSFSQLAPTVENLKSELSYLKDKKRIDVLNLVAYITTISDFPGFVERADTVYRYASLAFEESKKINYERGMVDALNYLAASEYIRAFGLRMEKKNDSANTATQQKYLTQAISLAKEINYDKGLGDAYMGWRGESKGDTTEYMVKAIHYFNKAGDERREGEACTWVAEGDLFKGYYENAFEYCQRGLVLNQKTLKQARTKEEHDWRNYLYQQSLSDIATLYKEAGDYESSLEYLNIASQFAETINSDWNMASEKAEIFRYLGKYDSSFYYLRKKDNPENKWTKQDIGATFLLTMQYDSALMLFKQALPEFRKSNISGQLIPILLYMGSAYEGKKEYKTALSYATEHTEVALKLKRRPDIMNGYQLLSRIHHDLGNNDSAYYYLDKYIALKDSIQSRQFLFRVNNYKKLAEGEKREAKLNLLDKDNKLKDAQLKQEVQQKNFLFILLSIFGLAGIFIYRSISLKRKNEKLKHEKMQTEFQQRTLELEMQALRAQMNPHFIFNCLSSINRFILKNEGKTASNYLTRFSRLIRMVLMNSQKSLIALDDELEMLGIYLEMEQLRFKNSFDYSINFLNAIESDNVFLPPLLLQPFCENAIWHGLMHKEGQGRLEVELSMKDNILQCIITDNGVGREKAAELKSKTAEKEKSLGLKITTERLALLNKEKSVHTFYEIEDVKDENGNVAGTRVTIKIGCKEVAEQIV